MGLGHHQLRLVGRYWSRRNVNFCGIAVVPPEMANGDQPFGRGDDHICGHHGSDFPGHPHGSDLGELLGVAIAEPIWLALGQLQLSAALGRFCHFDVLLCIVGILVHRSDSRLRDHSGPYDEAIRQEGLWFVELWLERKSQALDTI